MVFVLLPRLTIFFSSDIFTCQNNELFLKIDTRELLWIIDQGTYCNEIGMKHILPKCFLENDACDTPLRKTISPGSMNHKLLVSSSNLVVNHLI